MILKSSLEGKKACIFLPHQQHTPRTVPMVKQPVIYYSGINAYECIDTPNVHVYKCKHQKLTSKRKLLIKIPILPFTMFVMY